MNQSIFHSEVEKVNNNHHKITYIILLYFFKTIIKAMAGVNLSLTLHLKP